MPAAAKTNSLSKVIKALRLPQDSWCVIRPLSKEGGSTESAEAMALDPQARAEAVLAQAQAEARRMLAEAETKAATARQEGTAQGHQEGYRQGLAQAREENQAVVTQLLALADATEKEQHRLLGEMEPQLVDLALTIARKVVGEELATRPEMVTEIVARAIEEARGSGHRAIRLHPSDAELLRPHLPQAAIEAGGNEWEIRADESLSQGDCIIETAFGVVDARIDTQFTELAQVLKGALER